MTTTMKQLADELDIRIDLLRKLSRYPEWRVRRMMNAHLTFAEDWRAYAREHHMGIFDGRSDRPSLEDMQRLSILLEREPE